MTTDGPSAYILMCKTILIGSQGSVMRARGAESHSRQSCKVYLIIRIPLKIYKIICLFLNAIIISVLINSMMSNQIRGQTLFGDPANLLQVPLSILATRRYVTTCTRWKRMCKCVPHQSAWMESR